MRGGAELAADARATPFLTPAQGSDLRSGFGGPALPDAMRTVGALHAAGVPLLAGSDGPNPGSAHGASVHREIDKSISEQLLSGGDPPNTGRLDHDALDLVDGHRVRRPVVELRRLRVVCGRGRNPTFSPPRVTVLRLQDATTFWPCSRSWP